MLVWTVWANRLSYRQKRHRCSHLRIILLKWNCCCPVWGRIYTSSTTTRVADTKTENKHSWRSIITSLVMRRKNIHSLLTLAADPSEPNVGAAVQPRGWPVSRGVSGKAQPRFAQTTPSGRRGLLVWSLPSLCCRKRVKCTLLEPQTPPSGVVKTNPGRPNSGFVSELDAQKHPQWLYLCLWFQHESCIVCLERESWVFLCLFSACVTAKVQTICGSCFSFCSQQQGAVWE